MTDKNSWYDSKEYHDLVEGLSPNQVLMCRICDPTRRITKMATGGFVHWPPPTKEPNHYAQPYIPVPEGWEPSTEKANLMTETPTPASEATGYHYCVSCGDVIMLSEEGVWCHMTFISGTEIWQATSHHVHPVVPSSKRHPNRAYSWSVGRKTGKRLLVENVSRQNYAEADAKLLADTVDPTGEIRMTDPTTGAQKGSKEARFDLIPVGPLTELAELYGFGAKKYAPRNWERGYDFSLSYAAMQRHANLFWGGEDRDAETGKTHLASVAWHAFTLMQLLETHPEKDDRPSRELGDYDGIEVRDVNTTVPGGLPVDSELRQRTIWAQYQYGEKGPTLPMDVPSAYPEGWRQMVEENKKAFEAEAAGENGKVERTGTKMSESMSQKLKNAEALQEYEDLELQEVFETVATLSRQGLNRVINEAARRLEFNEGPQVKEEETPKETGVEEESDKISSSSMMEIGLIVSKMSTGQLLEVAKAVDKQLELDD